MKATQPGLSIVMPVYNVEEYLAEAIDSLLAQSYQDWELIMVDDCSPDRSAEIAAKYCAEDHRITYHKLDRNSGPSAARNHGLRFIRGKYFTFMDSDDLLVPDAYSKVMAEVERTGAQIVRFDYKIFNSKGEIPFIYHERDAQLFEGREELDHLALSVFSGVPGERERYEIGSSVYCMVADSGLLADEKLRFPADREILAEDLIFNFRCVMAAKSVYYMPEKLYLYRQNDNSLTHNVKKDVLRCVLNAAGEMERQIRAYGFPENALNYARGFCIGMLRGVLKSLLMSDLPEEEKRKRVSAVARDPYIAECYREYPWRKLPFKHRTGFSALAKNRYGLLKLLVVGQERARMLFPRLLKARI